MPVSTGIREGDLVIYRTASVFLSLTAIAGLGGCGHAAPDPSDPALGRETLQQTLEAWKKGDTLDAYKAAVPSVTVAEPRWKQGVKLLDFEIAGEAKSSGFDVQFQVQLSVQDAAGKKSTEKAFYNVSTSPRLVVVRSEPG